MKYTDTGSIQIQHASEAQSVQSCAELAMQGVESFFIAARKEKSFGAIRILNVLESIRDEAEEIECELESES